MTTAVRARVAWLEEPLLDGADLRVKLLRASIGGSISRFGASAAFVLPVAVLGPSTRRLIVTPFLEAIASAVLAIVLLRLGRRWQPKGRTGGGVFR